MPTTAADGRLHVVVGVVQRGDEVLLTRRAEIQHQGGKWEFPGGKFEAGEGPRDALHRELREELGIEVRRAHPLIRIPFDYEDRRVLLDVWAIAEYDGKPRGMEGQLARWVPVGDLGSYEFPAANCGIVTALQLPSLYLISNLERYASTAEFLAALDQALGAGVGLIQLREHHLNDDAYEELAREVIARVRRSSGRILLNRDPSMAARLAADGVHLTGRSLHRLQARPLPRPALVAASCHNEADLRKAEHIEADFAVLSPVQATTSHPAAVPMGWERFASLCDGTRIPIYALGGLRPEDAERARAHGAQGMAMIGGVWAAPSITDAVIRCQSPEDSSASAR
jgi:8-oxo-dGTP diphosphatase